MERRVKIAIMGMGVVGSALAMYLEMNQDTDLIEYDPPRGMTPELKDAEIVFIAVPIGTKDDRTQDLTHVESCLELLQAKGMFNVPIFIRSTILPGTTDSLAQKYMLRVCHMPEFLTERFAYEDVSNQPIICGGNLLVEQAKLLFHIFNQKPITFMSNCEAELSKYVHNGFGAMKVNYFNQIYILCLKLGIHYDRVVLGALSSGHINKQHTQVPGPDGQFGYGGKCFPKDLKALIGIMDRNNIAATSLFACEKENEISRQLVQVNSGAV